MIDCLQTVIGLSYSVKLIGKCAVRSFLFVTHIVVTHIVTQHGMYLKNQSEIIKN